MWARRQPAAEGGERERESRVRGEEASTRYCGGAAWCNSEPCWPRWPRCASVHTRTRTFLTGPFTALQYGQTATFLHCSCTFFRIFSRRTESVRGSWMSLVNFMRSDGESSRREHVCEARGARRVSGEMQGVAAAAQPPQRQPRALQIICRMVIVALK